MEIAEFRTKTKVFRTWTQWFHLSVTVLLSVIVVAAIYESLGAPAIDTAMFWLAIVPLGAIASLILAGASLLLWVLLALYVRNYSTAALRGITKLESDGWVMVKSTITGKQLVRLSPSSKNSVVVGLGRLGQTGDCMNKLINTEPVYATLYLSNLDDNGGTWVDLFYLTHDRDKIIASVNGQDIFLPYGGRPDYLKATEKVLSNYRPFSHLPVRDASQK